MLNPELPSDLLEWRHTAGGWFRREKICALVPVLADSRASFGIHSEQSGEARESTTPFGGDTCNSMRDSRGGRTISRQVGRWDKL